MAVAVLAEADARGDGRLALALAAVGKIDESIEQCKIVLGVNPNDAEMHQNLGLLYESKGQIKQAVESYKKAIEIDPNSPKARDRLNILSPNNPVK